MTQRPAIQTAWLYIKNGTSKHVLEYGDVPLVKVLKSICGVKVSAYMPVWSRWFDDPEVLATLPECRSCVRLLVMRKPS
jgi:hypothetical protein